MPKTYTCEKCTKVFKQKSHYDDHINRKNDCTLNTSINEVIEKKVEQKVKETINKLTEEKELVLPEDQIQRDKVLQAYFEEIHNILWSRAGFEPAKAMEHLTFFFAYRLIEIQAEKLELPAECRWSYLVAQKNENDMFDIMRKGYIAFNKNKITKPFFKQPEIKKATIVYDIVKHINKIPKAAIYDTDTLGNIFEYAQSWGTSTMGSEGQFFTNRKICKVAFKLAYKIKGTLRRKDGSLCTFADWFCGTGGFPAEYVKGVNENLADVNWEKDKESIYCQDQSVSACTTTLLNLLIMTGTPFSDNKIRQGNSFGDPVIKGSNAPFKGLTVDYAFFNPPYGGSKFTYSKKTKDENGIVHKHFFVNEDIQSIGIEDDDKVSAGIQLAMSSISEDEGVCSIVLPQGFFFGSTKKIVELRKKIAEEYKIYYVVDIASGSFLNTGTKTSMLVFQRGVGPTKSVKFIDLDENVLVKAKLADLREKNYSLNYKQYLPQEAVEIEGFQSIALKDICEFKRGTMITKASLEEGIVPVIGGGLSPMGYHNKSNRPANTILISQSGENAGFISKYNVPVWASDCFSIESQNKQILIDQYLYHILKSIESNIRALRNGTAQPHVYPSSIEHLHIAIPSLERQQEIVAAIDVWNDIAKREEEMLAMLEKQIMFDVKEMGRGKELVKLGDVCEIEGGTYITKKTATEGPYPVYGGGGISAFISEYNKESKFVVSKDGVSEKCVRYVPGKFFLNHHGWTFTNKERATYPYIGYWLLNNQATLYEQATGTAQKGINQTAFYDISIPLPSLTEQQTLQSNFDEIRHKHAKIAEYKAKTQEAIKRLIPGASTT